ncbi:hypothetical protein [Polyangium aurulentum]|uniref:hypothetical protein n=1 Tax=Polyangium aurulentum TaxID=2567896 RepID=UPI0010AE9E3B|nr:hypothetical protein [Polyangium aurulentum]UQA57142.1 hypothetical protein E8A73_038505 [Polyangium aurulentum]
MRRLPLWDDCSRCSRHEQRLAVVAPAWPSSVRVVVLGLAASRAAQAAQHHDPKILRVVDALQKALGLGPDECVADHLLACGLGRHIVADQVAACGVRFVEQERIQGARPEVVVLLGRETWSLAVESRLVDDRAAPWAWAPIGTGRRCAVVMEDDLPKLIRAVGAALGVRFTQPHRPSRAPLATRAQALLDVLGKHEGHRIKYDASTDWRTLKRPLSARLVAEHLQGRLWVAPHAAAGDWPYVVLDVDRHNAVQEQAFDRTLRKLQRHFPNSLFIQSSISGGVHVYVRLPGGTHYSTAARWMRAYLTMRGLRWTKVTAANSKTLQAELVEVPSHPPRLPFGEGSRILGSTKPLARQLDEVIAFLTANAPRDYTRAKNHAIKALRREGLEFKGRWTAARRRRLDAWLLRQELGLGNNRPTYSFPSSDPWAMPKLDDLPLHLRHVAYHGIPAYGTRVRWTYALVEALVNRVPETEVRELMAHWLKSRSHASEDVQADLAYALQETDAIITSTYRRLRGVPERFWREIEDGLRRFWAAYFRPPSASALPPPPQLLRELRAPHALDFDKLRKTAFFIARGFFAGRVQDRAIFAEEFEQYTGSNTAHDVQVVLTSGATWLRYESPAAAGVMARKYRILLWPRRRGEPSLFIPP